MLTVPERTALVRKLRDMSHFREGGLSVADRETMARSFLEGRTVRELATEHRVSTRAVYDHLKRQAIGL